MKWFVLAVVVVIGTFFVGATAIDKYDENKCKDRTEFAALRQECDGFLPW
jgi:hypothetical protein